MFSKNEILFGSYRILHCFQRGPDGGVFLVQHEEFLHKLFTLKTLKLSSKETEDLSSARFKNEISTTFELDHPNVVRSMGYHREANLVGLLLEYMPRGSMRDLINSQNKLSPGQTVYLIGEVLKGLHHIHANNIIHRDIRPENILFGLNGKVKIADFGDARAGATISTGRGITGKLDYLSPEYIKEGTLTEASDIYSLGVGLYELVSGTNPFTSDIPIRALAKRLTENVTPPHLIDSSIPKELSELIMKALEREPENRFKSSADFFQGLKDLTHKLSIEPIAFTPEPPPEIAALKLVEVSEELANEEGSQKSKSDSNTTSFIKQPEQGKTFSKKTFATGICLGLLLGGLLTYSSSGVLTTTANTARTMALATSPLPEGYYVLFLRDRSALTISDVSAYLSDQGYPLELRTIIDSENISFEVFLGPYESEEQAGQVKKLIEERETLTEAPEVVDFTKNQSQI